MKPNYVYDSTVVVNLRKERYDVYIGRGSKWGNPFKIGEDGDRKEVVEKYREWILRNYDLLNSLHELKGKRLGCYCIPLLCHGDVLVWLVHLGDEKTAHNRSYRKEKEVQK